MTTGAGRTYTGRAGTTTQPASVIASKAIAKRFRFICFSPRARTEPARGGRAALVACS